ncbi:hypothetical protein EI94DRAFT_318253 [Lactarius quietus]|nr:hypothetical protein EI94DRAFT_318253 [Lactarius quietus]
MNSDCPVHGIYPLPHTPGPFANLCLCSRPHETFEQLGNTEDHVSAQPQTNSPWPTLLIQSSITPPAAATKDQWPCSMCSDLFPRWQDRDRHELTHLPFFLHCPVKDCTWRGNRADMFKKHWQQEDHHSYHTQYGGFPEQSQIETFNPWEILDQIKNGAISFREGEDLAILLVQVKSYELEKLCMMTNPWGRSRRL